MKVLFLTSRLPFPPIGGDKLRAFNFIKHIKEKHYLTIISFVEDQKQLQGIRDYGQFYDKLITITLPKSESYRNCLKGLFSSRPLQVHYYLSREMKELVQKELDNGYDTVFCHLIRMAQYLTPENNINKVLDLTDAISLNYLRSKKYRKGIFNLINLIESRRVLKYELEAINNADTSIFISNIDADFLLNEKNKDKIQVVPNGVDFRNLRFYQGDYNQDKISFVGNMRTFPNTDAVLYFIEKIFPLLQQARPNLKFYVVGNSPTKEVARRHDGKNIFVTGYVHSVTSFVENSAVVVAPMRVGAGVQNKILEAMAVGTPVVTTPIGAEGLDTNKLTIGKTPQEFYLKTLALIEDGQLRNKKALIGRKYVEQKFAWYKQLDALEHVLTNGETSKELIAA